MLEQIEKTIYKVAIYIRLSKEDVDRGYDESESIKNQRTLLTEYVQKLGWKYQLIDTYIDQGFTGTNFNRPNFKKMIKDIENGKVNMDLIRFIKMCNYLNVSIYDVLNEENKNKIFEFNANKLYNYSSTEVRKAIKNGNMETLNKMLNKNVYFYIEENNLYK